MSANRRSRLTLWIAAILASDLPAREKYVALVLASYMRAASATAWPGKPALAKAASVSERTIDAAVKHLRRTGWLHYEDNVGGNPRAHTNLYTALLPEAAGDVARDAWAQTGAADGDTGRGASRATRGATKRTSRAPGAPEHKEQSEQRTPSSEARAFTESCFGCGAEFTTTDEDAVLCDSCRSKTA